MMAYIIQIELSRLKLLLNGITGIKCRNRVLKYRATPFEEIYGPIASCRTISQHTFGPIIHKTNAIKHRRLSLQP